ncbi:MinD/ParA family protein [Pelosinus sp. IPA-1]|uniref:MinD/ParA family protein n=1 Tax=Pelosinus sp. IPA-1 TaxID=3029569 RepID=UPI002436271E|nr:MinD/ParA family protein [Pelosinus sp. IPA-1]GMA99743.1 ATPase [Pelosinus sp. IPA-1]
MWDQAEKLRKMVQSVPLKPSSSVIKANHTNTRVITVTSGKGGVGKTNFTVNLALALAKLGQRVVILDADLGMGNVDVILGCSTPYNLLHLLEGGFSLIDIIADGPLGIKFLSGGSGIYNLANLNDSQLNRIVNQITLLDDIADIILIDTGAGINKSVMNFVVAADEVIIITTPEPTAITDAYAMMKTYANHSSDAVLKLVINRVLEPNEGNITADKLIKVSLKFLGLSINSLGFVCEDLNLVRAVKKQTPLLLAFPNSSSARCIEEIANRLLYGTTIKKTDGIKGFFNKLVGLMR